MNAVEAYRKTLENVERLKKEQITHMNNAISNQASCGNFSYNTTDYLYEDTRKDLTLRGFIVTSDLDSTYTRISWEPEILNKNE